MTNHPKFTESHDSAARSVGYEGARGEFVKEKYMAKKKVTRRDCSGCRNDFYNGHNDLGVAECWSLKTAEMKTRYELSVDTPMNQKSGYRKRNVPSCYHRNRFVFLDQIPNYAE